ncbi:MAG: hypothetical protein JWO95_2451 [Verrucomicrobiales bacterium]|nr:hypothetical protein [Verrucomicrobiales bacterium]
MNQWDIYMFPFSKEKRHPAIVISNDETCANSDIAEVNVLLCTSSRASRPAKVTEVLLDEADGLDWQTLARCDKIYLLPKATFSERKGSVTKERRHLIGRKIVEVLRLPIFRQ